MPQRSAPSSVRQLPLVAEQGKWACGGTRGVYVHCAVRYGLRTSAASYSWQLRDSSDNILGHYQHGCQFSKP